MTAKMETMPTKMLEALRADGIQPDVPPVRSAKRVDTGLWGRKSPVWIVISEGRLILCADGPRPYRHEISAKRLHGAFFNPLTSCLSIPERRFHQHLTIELPPDRALAILDLISQTSSNEKHYA